MAVETTSGVHPFPVHGGDAPVPEFLKHPTGAAPAAPAPVPSVTGGAPAEAPAAPPPAPAPIPAQPKAPAPMFVDGSTPPIALRPAPAGPTHVK